MWGDRIRPVAAGLLTRGFEPLPLEAGEREAFRRLGDVSARFFSAPDDILRRSQWSGEGTWAGYQPMPDGDPDVVDNIDRFEASHEMLSFPDDAWPWLSGPAHELRTALTAVDEVARRIVAACVCEVADLSGRGRVQAEALWCHDDSSTLVVNRYRAGPADGRSRTVTMKPHADFGGLTLINVTNGLDALQFDSGGSWQPLTHECDSDGDLVVVMIGQLFAHWLGNEAPVHRVEQDPTQQRMSTVYFHQPNFDVVIEAPDGASVVAGDHIMAMQSHYNGLA